VQFEAGANIRPCFTSGGALKCAPSAAAAKARPAAMMGSQCVAMGPWDRQSTASLHGTLNRDASRCLTIEALGDSTRRTFDRYSISWMSATRRWCKLVYVSRLKGAKTFATFEVVRCGNVQFCATLRDGVQAVAGSNPAVPITYVVAVLLSPTRVLLAASCGTPRQGGCERPAGA